MLNASQRKGPNGEPAASWVVLGPWTIIRFGPKDENAPDPHLIEVRYTRTGDLVRDEIRERVSIWFWRSVGQHDYQTAAPRIDVGSCALCGLMRDTMIHASLDDTLSLGRALVSST